MVQHDSASSLEAPSLSVWWAAAEELSLGRVVIPWSEHPPYCRALAEVLLDDLAFRVDEGRARLAAVEPDVPDGAFRRLSRLLELRLELRRARGDALLPAIASLRNLLTEFPPAEASTEARAFHVLGLALLALGHREEAEVALYQALPGIGDSPGRAWLLDTAGRVLQQTGAWEEARRLFVAVRLAKDRLDDPIGIAITAGSIARLELALHAPAEAEKALRAAQEVTRAKVPVLTTVRLQTLLLEVLLEEDRKHDADEAAEALEHLLADAPEEGHPLRGQALFALGANAAAQGRASAPYFERAQPHLTTPTLRAWSRYQSLLASHPDVLDDSQIAHLEALTREVEAGSEAVVRIWLRLAEEAHRRGQPSRRAECLAHADACAVQANQPLWLLDVDRMVRKLDPEAQVERVARRFTGRSARELGSTRRQEATIIFADMVGFSDISQVLDPEEVMRFSRGMFELAVPILAKHGVRPITYMGDAVLAVAEGERHRARGLAFAYEFVARVKRVGDMRVAGGEALHKKSGERWKLRIRAGVATGDAVFGVLGNAFKEEFAVIGRKTNLASRLQGAAEPDEVVYEDFDEPLPPGAGRESVVLKGFPERVSIVRWRIDATLPHVELPFVVEHAPSP